MKKLNFQKLDIDYKKEDPPSSKKIDYFESIGSKDDIPLAINQLKLQHYNFDFMSIDEILLLESLIVKAQSFKFKKFYYSFRRLTDEIGLKKNRITTALKSLEQKEFIYSELGGMPRVHYFTVRFDRIYLRLDEIFQFNEINQQSVRFYQVLHDFFKPLVKTYQEKNNRNKNNIKRIYSKEYSGSSFKKFKNVFMFKVVPLYEKYALDEFQLKYEDEQLMALLKIDLDKVLEAANEYFSLDANGNLSTFLTEYAMLLNEQGEDVQIYQLDVFQKKGIKIKRKGRRRS